MKSFSIFLAFALLLMPAIMHADPITREQAKQKAESYLANCKGNHRLKPVTNEKKLARKKINSVNNNTETYYVFNRGENEGYVIVPGDDKIDGVLGYTERGEFDYERIPANMKAWLDNAESYVAYVQEHKEEAPRKISTHAAIPYMMRTVWDQGWPYNYLCPSIDGSLAPTGCVATALAQVLYFNHDKSVDEIQADIPAYTTGTAGISMPSIPKGSKIDWDNMLHGYGGSTSDVQIQAVARLMLYCGTAVEMDYNAAGSGAATMLCAEAMNKYFGYSSAKCVHQRNYTDNDWDALIYNELVEGRVVLLGGYTNTMGGHAFVCDGYDGNKCYHINWGWSGENDGFFLLSNLRPTGGDGYNNEVEAIINAAPNILDSKEMVIGNATVKNLCLENFDANGDGVFTYGEAAAVTDVADVFKGQKFNAFTELYYFTGLKELSSYAFSGNTSLTTITLPKHLERIGDYAFEGCTKLKTVNCFGEITVFGKGAFKDCKALTDFNPSVRLTEIKDYAFAGCQSLTSFVLPVNVTTIGNRAFDGCTSLMQFYVNSPQPQEIIIGQDVFANIDLANATLSVLLGTEDFFVNAEQWKDFGNIIQKRTLTGGGFCELQTDKTLMLYNVGKESYFSAEDRLRMIPVMGETPMKLQLKRNDQMPADTYYILLDNGMNNFKYVLYRDDHRMFNSEGAIKSIFMDGQEERIEDGSSWWTVTQVAEGVYTFQIPKDSEGFEADKYMGVHLPENEIVHSGYSNVYYNVEYGEFPENCQWRFVEYDGVNTEKYLEGRILANLLEIATSRKVNCEFEQQVHDDVGSTLEELLNAQRTLRKKLGFINFKDPLFKNSIVGTWDSDNNNEMSYSEAETVYSMMADLARTDVRSLAELKYFKSIFEIYSGTFQDCEMLEEVSFPEYLRAIHFCAFNNCSKLETLELPDVTYFGANAFAGCKMLKTVSITVNNPADITMEENVFAGADLKNATLFVPRGSKALYEQAEQWKEFGRIEEMRGKTRPFVRPLCVGVQGYLYNYAEHKYINKGEAWGTQAVVSGKGMIYTVERVSALADGHYYLTSTETGREGKFLYRTDQDENVGVGIKACFVDGNMSGEAYWKIEQSAENNYFTIAVPDGFYGAGDLLGVDPNHETQYSSSTLGTYWDFPADDGSDRVKWGFVLKEDMDNADNSNALLQQLKQLLELAEEQHIEKTQEQAVYDNFDSSEEEISEAVNSLRHKLGYIEFADSRAKSLATGNWDDNDDGELSKEEAARVLNIGGSFKGVSNMKSLEELRHFTGLSHIPAEAFRGCSSMMSVYIPEGVDSIGEKAFTGCSALKYVAILAPQVVKADNCGISRTATIFVPEELIDDYTADPTWGKCKIKPYTGVPEVKADDTTVIYGNTKSGFSFEVSGAPINGEPEIVSSTEPTSPVGEYVIKCEAGTIKSPNLSCKDGTLTVTPATVTVTAKSYTRNAGEENPEFEVRYRGWKNNENDGVLISPVIVTCEATRQSPAGEYPIVPSGAVAQNYVFNYVNGKLTIVGSLVLKGDVNDDGVVDISDVVAIINVIASGKQSENADVNNDEVVDISDIVAVINIMAGNG